MSISTAASGRSIRTTCVTLRPISADEEGDWNALMDGVHPLGNAQFTGHRLKYVAEHCGQTVALLCISGSAYHLADRDRWIGWSSEQASQRRNFVVQNSRFLILPESERQNLASRVLSLCARRVCTDWEGRFGFAPVLMETFVDPVHFRGTCYQAAGWTKIGHTRGFRRDGREFYAKDSSPKDIWVKALRPEARDILSGPVLPGCLLPFEKALPSKRVADRLGCDGLHSLYMTLAGMDDPRRRQGLRHPLAACLAIVACAILAGCKGLRECAAFGASLSQRHLKAVRTWWNPKTRRFEAPCFTTLHRTLKGTDADQFEQKVNAWFGDNDLDMEAIAIDGKVLRATLGIEDGEICATSAVSHPGTPFFSISGSHRRKGRKRSRLGS